MHWICCENMNAKSYTRLINADSRLCWIIQNFDSSNHCREFLSRKTLWFRIIASRRKKTEAYFEPWYCSCWQTATNRRRRVCRSTLASSAQEGGQCDLRNCDLQRNILGILNSSHNNNWCIIAHTLQSNSWEITFFMRNHFFLNSHSFRAEHYLSVTSI